jgi:molecular chaperone GrpE
MATKRKTEDDTAHQPAGPDAVSVEGASPDEPRSERPPASESRRDQSKDAPKAKDAEAKNAEADDAERRVEELVSQLEEANSRRLRLAADFDNLKKRARQEQLDTMRYAAATLAERLLPVLDDADRANGHVPEGVDENWLKGVRLTFQKLEEVLGTVGVERVRAVGSPFDPKLHEAVGSEETADQPEDTVVSELRPGYRMHDRVLRPALVRVARPPA